MRNSIPPNPPPGQVPGDQDPEEYKKSVLNGAKKGVLREGVTRALHRLCRWKNVLAMWQLGERDQTDGEFRAVADAREEALVRSVECRAIVGALFAKKIITEAEWANALIMEAQNMEKYMEKRFPGFRANDQGIEIAPDIAAQTKKEFGFPQS